MKKICLLTLLICTGSFIAMAGEKQTYKDLKNQQRKIALTIFELRKALIQSDPILLELHNEKIKIHKQISERISGNPKMAELIEKAITLQAKLDNISDSKESSPKPKVLKIVKKNEPAKPKEIIKDIVTEPKFITRKKDTTVLKVIDKTADEQIESEDDGLSYE